MRKTSKIIIVTIIAASILLGLGYAAIQNITLNISGTAAADPNQANFKVRFTGTPEVSDSSYVTARISNDDWYQVGIRERDKVESLEKEIKKLKKQIANLTTLICTHIGEEQMKNFNEKHG